MKIVRTFACLLLIGLLAAPLQAQAQARPPSSEQISAVLYEIGTRHYVDAMSARMNVPPAVRPHFSSSMIGIRSNSMFRRYMTDAITTHHRLLTDTAGGLSIDRVHDYAIETTEALFLYGLQLLSTQDLRDYLTMLSTMLRRASPGDCLGMIGGASSDRHARAIELGLLARFAPQEIARYYQIYTRSVINALSPDRSVFLTASQVAAAERIFRAALQTTLAQRPDRRNIADALATLDNPTNPYHCMIVIMMYEEALRMQGRDGDLVVRWIARGRNEN